MNGYQIEALIRKIKKLKCSHHNLHLIFLVQQIQITDNADEPCIAESKADITCHMMLTRFYDVSKYNGAYQEFQKYFISQSYAYEMIELWKAHSTSLLVNFYRTDPCRNTNYSYRDKTLNRLEFITNSIQIRNATCVSNKCGCKCQWLCQWISFLFMVNSWAVLSFFFFHSDITVAAVS